MCFPLTLKQKQFQHQDRRVPKAYLSLLYHTLSSLPPPNFLHTSLVHRFKPYCEYTYPSTSETGQQGKVYDVPRLPIFVA